MNHNGSFSTVTRYHVQYPLINICALQKDSCSIFGFCALLSFIIIIIIIQTTSKKKNKQVFVRVHYQC